MRLFGLFSLFALGTAAGCSPAPGEGVVDLGDVGDGKADGRLAVFRFSAAEPGPQRFTFTMSSRLSPGGVVITYATLGLAGPAAFESKLTTVLATHPADHSIDLAQVTLRCTDRDGRPAKLQSALGGVVPPCPRTRSAG
jgi:hypothetical protein